MAVLFATTIAVATASIIYYRVGEEFLFKYATNEFSGPMTSTVELLIWIVPLTLAIIELGVAAWALAGGVQEERARVRGRP